MLEPVYTAERRRQRKGGTRLGDHRRCSLHSGCSISEISAPTVTGTMSKSKEVELSFAANRLSGQTVKASDNYLERSKGAFGDVTVKGFFGQWDKEQTFRKKANTDSARVVYLEAMSSTVGARVVCSVASRIRPGNSLDCSNCSGVDSHTA